MKYRAVIVAWMCLILLMPQTASAYIDPGTGSVLIQALIAVVAGIAVISRLYWHKIKSLLGLDSTSKDDDSSDDD